mmetsp:Transcript_56259/g.161459  ORF Transcript_56259/g.161459 Transcript_56259/m.161459 type:complete len:203 (-) Transcript_56259:769-1377(-)
MAAAAATPRSPKTPLGFGRSVGRGAPSTALGSSAAPQAELTAPTWGQVTKALRVVGSGDGEAWCGSLPEGPASCCLQLRDVARTASFAVPLVPTAGAALSLPRRYRSSPAPGGDAPKHPSTRRVHLAITAEPLPPLAARRSSWHHRCRIASATSVISAPAESSSNNRSGFCNASAQRLGAPKASSARSKEAIAATSGGRPGP